MNSITPDFIEKGMFRIIVIGYLLIVFYRLWNISSLILLNYSIIAYLPQGKLFLKMYRKTVPDIEKCFINLNCLISK